MIRANEEHYGYLHTALRSCHCFIYGFGIILFLGAYGLFQERVMSIPYGADFFQASTFLVLITRIFPILVSVFALLGKGEPVTNRAPFWQYFVVSLSNVGSTMCSYEALKSISFPMQMLGKSFKMVPVMLWGRLLSGKTYSTIDWIVAMTVTIGVTAFCVSGSIHAPQSDGSHVGIGILILCGHLFLSSFTPTFQEKIFKNQQASAYNMMLYSNICECIICCLILLTTGGFRVGMKFCSDHPVFLLHAAGISIVSMSSQLCIYPMIQEYGALAFAMTMNIRQVVSILASYSLYSKPITPLQIFGISLIFFALYYRAHIWETGEKTKNPSEKSRLLPASSAVRQGHDEEGGREAA